MEHLHIKTRNQELGTRNQDGQSLIEIMIGVAVGVILITSAATLISVTLKSSAQNKFIQAASFLSQDLIEKVTIFAERQWYCNPTPPNCGIYNLMKGSANHYFLNTSVTPFEWVSPVSPAVGETINLDGVPYTRYFYAEDVIRELCGVGAICTGPGCSVASCLGPGSPGAAYDPSTQKITVVTSWTQAGTTSDIKIVKYVTRSRNQVFVQTDWSGGADPAAPPLPTPNNKFHSSVSIDHSSLPGSIRLSLP